MKYLKCVHYWSARSTSGDSASVSCPSGYFLTGRNSFKSIFIAVLKNHRIAESENLSIEMSWGRVHWAAFEMMFQAYLHNYVHACPPTHQMQCCFAAPNLLLGR